eukprot:1911970-Amphidinium_carterae.1
MSRTHATSGRLVLGPMVAFHRVCVPRVLAFLETWPKVTTLMGVEPVVYSEYTMKYTTTSTKYHNWSQEGHCHSALRAAMAMAPQSPAEVCGEDRNEDRLYAKSNT